MGRKASPLEIAYAAGFFDGEGCVVIEERLLNGTPNFRTHVAVSQINPEPLKLFMEVWDGHIGKRRRKNGIYFQWTAHTAIAARFLSDIAPLVIVKRTEVEIALAFRARINSRFGRNGMGEPEREIRRDMIAKLKASRANKQKEYSVG